MSGWAGISIESMRQKRKKKTEGKLKVQQSCTRFQPSFCRLFPARVVDVPEVSTEDIDKERL